MADELRSLRLKNANNKVITGTNCSQFRQAISDHAVAIQRGVLFSRQMVLNIPDLDSIARAMPNFGFFPKGYCLALWEFKAAFPSVRHQWIMLVFRAYGFPLGFLLFLEALFHHNFAFYCSKGFQTFLYLILACIVQGCPAAGMCFVVAADLFFLELSLIQGKFPCPDNSSQHTAFRGCADDIGASLASYKFSKVVSPVFDKASCFALKMRHYFHEF